MVAVRVVLGVLIASIAGVSHACAQATSERWQSSWERFIDDYNACTKTQGCDLAKFADQDVTWKGQFARMTSSGDDVTIRIELTPRALMDPDGKPLEGTVPPQPLKDIDLNCKSGDAEPWKAIAAGAPVTFRGRTRSGGAISFSSMAGRTFVVYYLTGCGLVQGTSG